MSVVQDLIVIFVAALQFLEHPGQLVETVDRCLMYFSELLDDLRHADTIPSGAGLI